MATTRPTRSARQRTLLRPSEHVEVETTLDVEDGWSFPADDDLLAAAVRAAGAGAVAAAVEHHLLARYFDTADLALARSRTTLRRRSGGDDAGWHLKLPGGSAGAAASGAVASAGARTEVRLPLRAGSQGVPRALSALVLATTRGAGLHPVVELATTRRTRRVLAGGAGGAGEGGAVLAEVVDDLVVARLLVPGEGREGGATEVSWRELEVELVDGEPALLDALVDALVAAGAARGEHPSKLRRALAGPLAALPPAPPPPAPVGPASSTADVVRAHLHAQRRELLDADLALRRADDGGATEPVHRLRVAARRLRSALATFRHLLDGGSGEELRAELGWWAGELAAARDADVTGEALRALLRSQRGAGAAGGGELLDEATAQRLLERSRAGSADGLVRARAALTSPRYLRLLDALDALVDHPPLTGEAARPAAKVLPQRAAHDHHRLVDAADAADGARDAAARTEALHDVRKAAKRARYGAEVAAGVVGKGAARYAAAAKEVQGALGEVQDAAVLRSLLREVAAQARRAGEDTFALGRLHALQEQRAAGAEDDFERAWHELTRKRTTRWLR